MQDIRIEYVESAKQRADALTKPLAGPQHANAMQYMRLEKLRSEKDGEENLDGTVDGAFVKGSVEE